MLRSRFEHFLLEQRLLTPHRSVLLAVSGGIDSMVMLNLFVGIADAWQLHLSVVHANHQLRGDESDADEAFVDDACRRLHVAFTSQRLPVREYAAARRISLQLAARELRYRFFEEARLAAGADAAATAHHADDVAETVLLNILRGAGLRGLAGIPAYRREGCVIRPLLFATRAEIESFAGAEGISFRTDRSNDDLHYARNVIRHQVLPSLCERNASDVRVSLRRVAEVLSDIVRTLDQLVASALPEVATFDGPAKGTLRVALWEKLDPLVREHLALEILRRLEIDATEERIRAISRLARQQAGRVVDFGRGWKAHRERSEIRFIRNESAANAGSVVLDAGRVCQYDGYLFSVGEPEPRPAIVSTDARRAMVDADRIHGAISVRHWHAGDWFIPLGMDRRKKLSDFFIDRKVPRLAKSRIPLLAAGDDIVWVCGMQIDDRFKVTATTTRILQLTYQPIADRSPQ